MKRLAIAALAVLACSGMAFAQAGSIGMFADVYGTNCNLSDPGPGVMRYYVVHVQTPGATACQFSAPKPACFTATWLSDTNFFPVTIGNSQIGTSIGYGTCEAGPINVLIINYFTNGTTPPCCYYPVMPDPTAVPPGIWVVDCQNHLLAATGGTGIVNAGPTCHCGTPTGESTWGRVKALYTP